MAAPDSRLHGYGDPGYADSLKEWGHPVKLASSDGWLLERPIAGSPHHDAMGCYPLFSCGNWDGLADDIAQGRSRWVSVSIVTDPFGCDNPEILERAFDRVIAFKEHFVASLTQSVATVASPHHARRARRGLRNVVVDVAVNALACLDEWVALYDVLSARHAITGLRRFSRAAFADQLAIPGMQVLRARCASQTVGLQLYLQRDEVVYYHLAAYDERGYESSAAYALHWTAHEYFRTQASWLSLGAGAGSTESSNSLADFKHGWSTGTRQVYYCSRILQPDRYAELRAATANVSDGYFPAYRSGEF